MLCPLLVKEEAEEAREEVTAAATRRRARAALVGLGCMSEEQRCARRGSPFSPALLPPSVRRWWCLACRLTSSWGAFVLLLLLRRPRLIFFH